MSRSTGIRTSAHYALPLAFSPFNWQLIARYPDHYARAAVNLKPDFAGTRPLFDESFVTELISSEMTAPQNIKWQELPAMHTVKLAEGLPGTAFYSWFARFPVLLKKSGDHLEFGDLAFGGGASGVRPAFQLHIDLQQGSEAPRAWLIWRNDRKSELTLTSAPFNWL